MFFTKSTERLENVQQYMVRKLWFEINQSTWNQNSYKEKESTDFAIWVLSIFDTKWKQAKSGLQGKGNRIIDTILL